MRVKQKFWLDPLQIHCFGRKQQCSVSPPSSKYLGVATAAASVGHIIYRSVLYLKNVFCQSIWKRSRVSWQTGRLPRLLWLYLGKCLNGLFWAFLRMVLASKRSTLLFIFSKLLKGEHGIHRHRLSNFHSACISLFSVAFSFVNDKLRTKARFKQRKLNAFTRNLHVQDISRPSVSHALLR